MPCRKLCNGTFQKSYEARSGLGLASSHCTSLHNKSSCACGAPPKMKKDSVPVGFAQWRQGKQEHILQAEPAQVTQVEYRSSASLPEQQTDWGYLQAPPHVALTPEKHTEDSLCSWYPTWHGSSTRALMRKARNRCKSCITAVAGLMFTRR